MTNQNNRHGNCHTCGGCQEGEIGTLLLDDWKQVCRTYVGQGSRRHAKQCSQHAFAEHADERERYDGARGSGQPGCKECINERLSAAIAAGLQQGVGHDSLG